MTGDELKQLREDLGLAVGRRLSLDDMAKLCGLASANGADTIRKWEDGDGPSGPVTALLSLLRYATITGGELVPDESIALCAEIVRQAGADHETTAVAVLKAAMMCEVVIRLRD
ncbi:hypothetical protein [Tardiphaga sp. 709]|uniref:helix-turn-helix domain-containing protein n=1 Tax=Tardiphaga sp. 709 TaxID=3076039 RepID=UPI0028E91BB3|nr:hypothetical protein [Tardiphaga sp. 709]WNV10721.1 hypothetical protein RSO67_05905 [Tardiphaga sp. 709]